MISEDELRALELLKNNTKIATLNGKTYRRTPPSEHYYLHQFFWDSCTHAMGLVYYDPQWAYEELASLLAAQWENGFIGHIIYSEDEKRYFPTKELWGTEKFSQKSFVSSGFIQPPLLAISLNHIDEVLHDKGEKTDGVDSLIAGVVRYHNYLKRFRDREDSGLLTIIHPWESGCDNSPRWDSVMESIDLKTIPQRIIDLVRTNRKDISASTELNRPRAEYYYRYLYLIDVYKQQQWDTDAILDITPFAVKDVQVSSIWAKANQSLAAIMKRRGRIKEADYFSSLAEQTNETIRKCWNEKAHSYANFDVSHGQKKPIYSDDFANFMPLYSHAASDKQVTALLTQLSDPQKYWTKYPVPSVSPKSPFFEITRYWRGPTWPIVNLFILEGLKGYTAHKQCQKLFKELVKKTADMIRTIGFYETYDPNTGLADTYKDTFSGMGYADFSWSAAIYLYLKNKYPEIVR